jgi:hypothetical protein
MAHNKRGWLVTFLCLIAVSIPVARLVWLRISDVETLWMTEDRDDGSFALRTDAPPREWKAAAINDGLPYRWEAGRVHLLVWEVIEDRGDSRNTQRTQVIVLKRFHRPTEKGQDRWVLAHLYHHSDDKQWPWHKDMLILPPVPRGEKMPDLTDAQVFGHEFYKALPTDDQIESFLRQVGWAPSLGPQEAWTLSDDKVAKNTYTTTLAAGGVNRSQWKALFGRDVPSRLFPELRVPPAVDK